MAVNAQTALALTREHHGYRFVILGVVLTSYLIVYLSRLSVGPLALFLKDSFHLSNAEVGSLMSATVITYAPSMIVAGLLVDKLGVKRTLVGGTLVAGICVALLFVAPSYPVLLALSGFGSGCIYPSGTSVVDSDGGLRQCGRGHRLTGARAARLPRPGGCRRSSRGVLKGTRSVHWAAVKRPRSSAGRCGRPAFRAGRRGRFSFPGSRSPAARPQGESQR